MNKNIIKIYHTFRYLKSSLNIIFKNNYSLTFKNDSNVSVELPKIKLFNILISTKLVQKTISYSDRPISEPLMRLVSSCLIKDFIDNDSIIIDIGAWIGDNSIPWAKLLALKGEVVAIDPSKENLKFIGILSKLNNIQNISLINAVCSDKVNQKLSFDGSIDHTSFRELKSNKSDKILYSTTLDKIHDENYPQKKVSFIHLDVEGFELRVLKGTENILKKYNPFVIFELHLNKSPYTELFEFINRFNYDIYMINEIIPGNYLDCRNFIAIPKKHNYIVENLNSISLKNTEVYSAVIGNNLI